MQIDLSGRVAVVVGGGGGGIGSAAVEHLARAGADVGVITYVADDAADSVAAVEALGRKAASVVVDVTDEAALVAALEELRSRLGLVRHLVNVVGGTLVDDWHKASAYDMDAFDRIISRNLRYAVVACREVATALFADGQPGSIVNTSSVSAKGTPLLGAYSAAKAGLEAFSRTMAMEWGSRGVRVNCVAPGTIRTRRAGMDDMADEAARTIPLGRRGTGDDIAAASLFLLSDMAAYITGQTLVVDGGSTLGGNGDKLPVYVTNPAVRARFDD